MMKNMATCPSCHTIDAAVTNDALSKGTDWECARCGAQWNARRLATAAGYALWLSGHNNAASRGLHEQYDNGLKRI